MIKVFLLARSELLKFLIDATTTLLLKLLLYISHVPLLSLIPHDLLIPLSAVLRVVRSGHQAYLFSSGRVVIEEVNVRYASSRIRGKEVVNVERPWLGRCCLLFLLSCLHGFVLTQCLGLLDLLRQAFPQIHGWSRSQLTK